jgi:hypothetical protein
VSPFLRSIMPKFQYDDGWLRGIPRSCNGSQALGAYTM